MAAPDTQWQNGFCERHWGHIKQMAHKMLVNARLPLQFLDSRWTMASLQETFAIFNATAVFGFLAQLNEWGSNI